MNKKGFTIIEVIVSFAILAVVMLAIITFMITYRDKVKNSEVETQLLDFKNSFSKMIYDEIIEGNYLSIEYCDDALQDEFTGGCAYFLKSELAGGDDKDYIGIKVLESRDVNLNLGKGTYLYYAGKYYLLPDSDLNTVKTDRLGVTYNDDMCDFSEFRVDNYVDKIYSLNIKYHHYGLDKDYEMIFLIN